jgi:hypothetical protein
MRRLLESQFGTYFKPYFLANRQDFPENCVFEYKITNTSTFNLSAWRKGKQAHQISKLLDSSNGRGVFYKMIDSSADRKPYDTFFLSTVDSFLVVWFNKYQSFTITRIEALVCKDKLPMINPKKLLAKKIIKYEEF